MMRVLITAGLVAATMQQAMAATTESFAESFPETTIIPRPSGDENGAPSPTTKTRTGTYTEYNSQDLPSMSPEELSSYSASLTSVWGPFHTTFVFMPGAYDGDWLSAASSGVSAGPKDDGMTTWEAYGPEYFTDPGNTNTPGDKKAYWTMASGPSVYHDEMVYPAYTNSDYQNMDITTSFHGAKITTHCTFTAVAPKISVPDEVWATQDPNTLKPDNWATFRALCTVDGTQSLKDGVSTTNTVQTLSDREGWRHVTVLGVNADAKAVAATASLSGKAGKKTESAGEAAETGSGTETEGAKATSTQAAGASEVTAWVNAVVVVAVAAVLAI